MRLMLNLRGSLKYERLLSSCVPVFPYRLGIVEKHVILAIVFNNSTISRRIKNIFAEGELNRNIVSPSFVQRSLHYLSSVSTPQTQHAMIVTSYIK